MAQSVFRTDGSESLRNIVTTLRNSDNAARYSVSAFVANVFKRLRPMCGHNTLACSFYLNSPSCRSQSPPHTAKRRALSRELILAKTIFLRKLQGILRRFEVFAGMFCDTLECHSIPRTLPANFARFAAFHDSRAVIYSQSSSEALVGPSCWLNFKAGPSHVGIPCDPTLKLIAILQQLASEIVN